MDHRKRMTKSCHSQLDCGRMQENQQYRQSRRLLQRSCSSWCCNQVLFPLAPQTRLDERPENRTTANFKFAETLPDRPDKPQLLTLEEKKQASS
jgi:hypothetical protein